MSTPILSTEVNASELASAIGAKLIGKDLKISCVRSINNLANNCLAFSRADFLSSVCEATVIAPMSLSNRDDSVSIIVSNNPRLDFARALLWLRDKVGFSRPGDVPRIDSSVSIGKNCVIGQGVVIDGGTVIGNNVTITDGVRIGKNCVIKSCAVIGEDGFGFERDEEGMPLRLIHLGNVVIGDDVEVGSFTTVCRGTLDDTVIEDHAKIDDHVHIAHNVKVRSGAMVIACAEVSGGVEIGERAWIGPNSSTIQKVKIGENALIGIAANVLKDVPPGATIIGNPGKKLQRQ